MSHHPVINILSAEQVGDYALRIHFDDGVVQTVDFGAFLARSHHPEIREFLDLSRFADFRIDHGELVWGDYELCFPIMDLYRNRLEYRNASDQAA